MANNDQFVAAWQALNADQSFRQLTYEEQQQVRADWLTRNIPRNEAFQNLSPNEVAYIFQDLVSKPPALEGDNQQAREFIALGQGVRSGDAQSLNRAASWGAEIGVKSFAGPIFALLDRVTSAIFPEGHKPPAVPTDPDGKKALEYMRQQVYSSSEATGLQKWMVGDHPLIGIANNIVAGRTVAGPLLRGAKSWGAATAMTAAGGRVTRWLLASAIPETVESVADGILMTANDVMYGKEAENTPFGLQAQSRLGQIALNFGVNFAQDMLIFTGMSLLGHTVKNAWRGVRGRGFAAAEDVATSDLTHEEYQLALLASVSDMPAEQFGSLSDDLQRRILEERRLLALGAKNLTELTEDEAADLLAHRVGYRLEQHGDSFLAVSIADEQPLGGYFSSKANAAEAALRFNSQPPDQSARILESSLSNEFTVQRQIRATLTDQAAPVGSERTLAAAFTPDTNGILQRKAIETATRGVLREVGAEADTIRKVGVRAIDPEDYWKLESTVTDNAILVPSRITTADELSRVVRNYASDVQRFIPADAAEITSKLNRLVDVQQTIAQPTNLTFLKATAEANGIPFETRGGRAFLGGTGFDTAEEAAQALNRQLLQLDDIASAKKQFGKQFGLSIEEADGNFTARRGADIVDQAQSLPKLVDNLQAKGFSPRIGQEKAANVIIDGNANELVVEGGTVRGPWEYIRDYGNEFWRGASQDQVLLKQGTDTISRNSLRTTFKVSSPSMGAIKEFENYKDAVAFIESNLDDLSDLKQLGTVKGVLDIQATGGKIIAQEIGQAQPRVFDSVDQLKKYLVEKTPDPVWEKEISNMNTALIDKAVDSFPPELKKQFLAGNSPKQLDFNDMRARIRSNWKQADPKNMSLADRFRGAKGSIAALFSDPTYTRMRRAAGYKGHDKLVEGFESMEKANFNARGMLNTVNDQIANVARVEGLTDKRRLVLRPFIEADEGKWSELEEKLKVILNESDREYLNRFRVTSNHLGRMFGIDTYKMWNNYLPHLREWKATQEGIEAAMTEGSAATLVRQAFGGKMPRELEFAANYMRRDDLWQFIDEADPQRLLQAYASKGVKNITLGKTYETLVGNLEDWLKGGEIDLQDFHSLSHYIQEVMGMYSEEAAQLAEMAGKQITETFWHAISPSFRKDPSSKKALGDMISIFHGFTIAATMSWRPWLPIRNMQQIWTTLAPRFGNSRVMDALKKMSDNEYVEQAHKRLSATGRLHNRIPIYGLTGEVILKRFNKAGMRFYKNSDEYTRIVVDATVRDTFGEAVAKLESGRINNKQFMALSGLRKLDQFDQKQIIDLLETRGYNAAVDYYGDVVTRETMFAYTSGSNPTMFRGLWGRLFGMFGHYSVYYARNVMNGLTRGTMTDKLAYVSRLAFNSAALWFTFDKVLGIKADAFVPWKTMFFDGGPYFQLLTDAMSAAAGGPGAPSWSSIATQAERTFIPGSLARRGFFKGLGYLQQGDVYRGFLQMMSVPTAPESPTLF